MTSYVVLERTGASRWDEVGDPVDAHGDKQAIAIATKDRDADARNGAFVAVPARSWNPRIREVQVKEVDRWA